MQAITFGSLFAGIGGIDLGLERAGMSCKWQVEIDKYAQRVLAKHWPSVQRWDDVRTWPQPDTEPVDLIAAGFPCQDISYAGKGAGLDGERSGLFFEVARIIRAMEPRFVLLENVAALLTRGMGDVLGTLASLGYDAEWHCIPAAAVGAPHIRDRVFILAYTNDPGQQQSNETLAERQAEQPDRSGVSANTNSAGLQGWLQNGIIDPKRREVASIRLTTERSNRGLWDGDGQWAAEPAVGRVANGIPGRVDRLKGLGNAVVPQVAEFIGRHLMDALAN